MTERGKLAVTIDVEDWYHLPAVTGAPGSKYGTVERFREKWTGRWDYLTKPTRRTLDLLDELDIRATFFIVTDVVDAYPGLVAEIADRGHEIGCHGLHHECALDPTTKDPLFDSEEYATILSEARQTLQAASSHTVEGFRAPNAYIGGWTRDVLETVGFAYDSSVAPNSLYNKTDSELSGVTSQPYRPGRGSLEPGGSGQFVEVPWPYYELGPYRIPTGGGPLIRLFPKILIERGLQQSLRRGDSIFYFHPLDIATDDFPILGGAKRKLFWATKGKRTEQRIRSILQRFEEDRFVTCGDIARRKINESVKTRETG